MDAIGSLVSMIPDDIKKPSVEDIETMQLIDQQVTWTHEQLSQNLSNLEARQDERSKQLFSLITFRRFDPEKIVALLKHNGVDFTLKEDLENEHNRRFWLKVMIWCVLKMVE